MRHSARESTPSPDSWFPILWKNSPMPLRLSAARSGSLAAWRSATARSKYCSIATQLSVSEFFMSAHASEWQTAR